jgi:hypothetical protein
MTVKGGWCGRNDRRQSRTHRHRENVDAEAKRERTGKTQKAIRTLQNRGARYKTHSPPEGGRYKSESASAQHFDWICKKYRVAG